MNTTTLPILETDAGQPIVNTPVSSDTPRNGFDSVREFVYLPKALEVADALVRTGAYRVNMKLPKERWFTWRSGIKAPSYCDCRTLNAHSLERRLVTATLVESVRRSFPQADLIVGMATAGIPWARTLADELDLPLAYVRSVEKAHGLGGRVECSPPNAAGAVLIDDLVASGESIKQAADALAQEKGIRVIGVHSIVNWGFPKMRRNLTGIAYRSLTSFPQILTLALNHSLINEHEFIELMAFYQNPGTHQWAPATPDQR